MSRQSSDAKKGAPRGRRKVPSSYTLAPGEPFCRYHILGPVKRRIGTHYVISPVRDRNCTLCGRPAFGTLDALRANVVATATEIADESEPFDPYIEPPAFVEPGSLLG